MFIELDRSGNLPLQFQIRAALERAMQAGELRPGARLPSTRALARRLRVSRNTVLAAYADLRATGLISAQQGSGTVVGRFRAPGRARVEMRLWARLSHYPSDRSPLSDPDGNPLFLYR